MKSKKLSKSLLIPNSDENIFFSSLLKSIPKKIWNFSRLSLAIASQINALLKKQSLSQRNFAAKLNRKESEISKWLSGGHNFTLRTIASLESFFDQQILFTREEVIQRFFLKLDNSQSSVGLLDKYLIQSMRLYFYPGAKDDLTPKAFASDSYLSVLLKTIDGSANVSSSYHPSNPSQSSADFSTSSEEILRFTAA